MTQLPTIPITTARCSQRQRDFLLLNIFVAARHGYLERAKILAEALHALGDTTQEVLLARAIILFLLRDWRNALSCLEELDRHDPVERFGTYTLSERQRMRRYLKARACYELDDHARARDIADSYLRHGARAADPLQE